MNSKYEKLEKNIAQLEIEVDAAKFEEAMQKSFLKNRNKFNLPGFRKGKAPRNIVERYYGESILYEDAINIAFPDAYEAAIEEHKLEPVDRPDIDIKEIGSGKNLKITAKVTLKPEVELGQYKGVEVSKKEAVVADEEVEKEIEKLREKNSRLMTIEDRPVQQNDTAIIDFEGFVDGVPFEGGKGEGYELVIGSNTFIPGFEDQLIGVNSGEEKDVNVSFPDEYHSKELAGKPAVFKVKVKEIKFKELPAADDEFAKDVSEFETLEELKNDTRRKLQEKADSRAKRETEDEVIKKVNENATVEIPQVMVDQQVDRLVRDFDMRLQYQGLNLEKYLEYTGSTMDIFRQQFAERAQNEVKTQLVLEAVGKAEKIEPAEEDVNEEIKKLAENYKQEIEEFKQHLRPEDIEYIKGNLTIGKTIDFLVSNAKIQ